MWCHAANDDLVLFLRGVVLELRVGVLLHAVGDLPGPAGQAARRQGAVGRQGDVFLVAVGNHLPFLLPEDQVVVPLHGHELRPALPLGDGVGLRQLPGEAVGYADAARPARLHLPVQAVQYVLDGRLPVPHVVDVQVDVIHAQVFKALVQHIFDVLLPGDARLDLVLRPGQELGGHHHLVPLRKVPQGAAHVLLAGAGLVGDGGVVEVDAQFQPAPYDLAAVFLVQRPAVLALPCVAEAHAAHADAGYRQIGVAKLRIFHVVTPPEVWSGSCGSGRRRTDRRRECPLPAWRPSAFPSRWYRDRCRR